jgi:hypothetical protein
MDFKKRLRSTEVVMFLTFQWFEVSESIPGSVEVIGMKHGKFKVVSIAFYAWSLGVNAAGGLAISLTVFLV